MDRQAGLGGLLMAQGQTDIGVWQQRIGALELPPLRWQWRRGVIMLLAAGALATFVALAPQRYLLPTAAPPRSIEAQVHKLADEIQLLAQEKLLPQDKAKTMEQTIEQVQHGANSEDPARTLEALDHLEQELAQVASQASEQAAKAAQAAEKAKDLAEAMAQADSKLSAEMKTQAAKELAELTRKAAEGNEELSKKFGDAAGQALDKGQIDPKQAKELAEALDKAQQQEMEQLERLCKAGLADAELLQACKEACQQGGANELAEALKDAKSAEEVADLVERNGSPGKGGVDRGRGDAAITWQNEASSKDVQFKEKPLTPAAIASMKEGKTVGQSASDPTNPKGAEVSSGGGLSSGSSDASSAHKQVVLPRHRQTVQKYFEHKSP